MNFLINKIHIIIFDYFINYTTFFYPAETISQFNGELRQQLCFFLTLYGPNSFFRRFSGHNLR